ncbi:MAG: KH domain-containing protein [Candidatus Hodarchaeales archaeon]|jgi:ribosomal RNA assembly protein
MKEIVLIPKERINIINDNVIKELEKLNVEINIKDNSIEIDGDGLELYQAKNIVKAIGRGFSPERAFRLLNEEEQLEVIELKEYTENKIKNIKSRVIGSEGKTRMIIEKDTKASVSVYGKTISIIGEFEQIKKAKEAIDMLIRGAKHSKVYRFLGE